MTKLKILKNTDIGKWIKYKNGSVGKIKSFDNKLKIAWIVYKCDDNWDTENWKNYTAKSTKYNDLLI